MEKKQTRSPARLKNLPSLLLAEGMHLRGGVNWGPRRSEMVWEVGRRLRREKPVRHEQRRRRPAQKPRSSQYPSEAEFLLPMFSMLEVVEVSPREPLELR